MPLVKTRQTARCRMVRCRMARCRLVCIEELACYRIITERQCDIATTRRKTTIRTIMK